jgi:hypothetical protein
VRRGALGSEVDAIGSLELDLKLGCAVVSMCKAPGSDAPDLQRRGRSPC